MSLAECDTLYAYLEQYGKKLGRKAIEALDPLHVPGVSGLPDFSEIVDFNPAREPFPPQKDVIAGTMKMMDRAGSGFIVGEMGVGKTLLGIVACHLHARGNPYRAMVLCPDHLIGKWCREIQETLPDVTIRRFDNWKGIMDLLDHGFTAIKEIVDPETGATTVQHRKRWSKPVRPEWYVLGRNQAKFYPKWLGIGEEHAGFAGKPAGMRSSRSVVVKHELKKDEKGKLVHDADGKEIIVSVIDRWFWCPRCGSVPSNSNGALSADTLAKRQVTCEGLYAVELIDPENPKRTCGRDILLNSARGTRLGQYPVGKEFSRHGVKYVVRKCGEPLWNYISKPYKWPPARIVQSKCRRMFKYLIVDESHEHKSDESAQSMAMGKLLTSARHVLAMTGTIIGGYANHLYPLMMRLFPETLRGEGFEWGKDAEFNRTYGRVDRIVTTTQEGFSGDVVVTKKSRSMRRSRSGSKVTEREEVRPGVMPSLFGRHMIGNAVFLTLDELASELPRFDEYPGGDQTPGEEADPNWIDTAVDMDAEQRTEYDIIERELVNANRELLKNGSMKLLGATLFTLLDYPDMPYDWHPQYEDMHAVGYHREPKVFTPGNFVGVVTPKSLDRETIRPKEAKLIEIVRKEKAEGRQVWIYCQMTKKRNVMPRLQSLLEAEGMTVKILNSDRVDTKVREEWIAREGKGIDVMISHPKPVETGLDLFSKDDEGHNFASIVFYETGYNAFTAKQASRRSWRIGQPLDCRVYYLWYKDSMQARAISLISRKFAALATLNGDFSTEGLMALAGEDNAQIALARTLKQSLDDADMQRNWAKIRSSNKKVGRSSGAPGIPAALEPPTMSSQVADVIEMVVDTILPFEPPGGTPGPSSEDVAPPPPKKAERPRKLKLVKGESADEAKERAARKHLESLFKKLLEKGFDLDELFPDDE